MFLGACMVEIKVYVEMPHVACRVIELIGATATESGP